jgi:ubiquinone/menaquinone biosynthesis C-methylase UbiE
MDHADHVRLLRDGVPSGGAWADLGSGAGAFTLALADLVGATGEIYSVDRDVGALQTQERAFRARFPSVPVRSIRADFTRPLELPPLDGVVMANSLHFQRDKRPVLSLVRGYLKPGGRLILVEYNVDKGNLWVPHPISYRTWVALAARCQFRETRLLATVPSGFLDEIYSAQSLR